MALKCDLVLKNVSLTDGTIKDISIKNGHVIHSGSQIRSDFSIDCSGYTCIPGAVDMHVHMRGGDSQSYKETWESGSKSALAGGVTTVIDQPNTIPPIIDYESFTKRVNEAKEQSYCNFGINGSVIPGGDIYAMYKAGAIAFGETFFAESSYGSAVDSKFLKEAFKELIKLNALATIHAEIINSGDDCSIIQHESLRSCENETLAVKTVLDLAPGDLRLHFCHLSSPQSIDLVACNENATFEIMPHHLFLSVEMFEENDGRAKVNPPVRHEDIRKSLWAKWNEIDVIASDHAPHTFSEKTDNIFSAIPSGIPGVETMIPLLMNQVSEKKITLQSVIEKTVYNPSKILRIKSSGYTPGCIGDFALYPDKSVKIESDSLHSKAGWTPYEGMKAVFPDIIIIGGNIVYDRGEFFKGYGKAVKGNGYIA